MVDNKFVNACSWNKECKNFKVRGQAGMGQITREETKFKDDIIEGDQRLNFLATEHPLM